MNATVGRALTARWSTLVRTSITMGRKATRAVLWSRPAVLGAGVALALLSGVRIPSLPQLRVLLVAAAWACLLRAAWGPRPRSLKVAPLAFAAWATRDDAAAFAAPGALLLGLWPETRAALYLSHEQASGHVLVLGPSRSGKTAGAIAPNVLLRDPSRESVVVLDVKTGPRCLWNVTAGRYGRQARLFCPLFEGSVGYNPLDEIDSIGAAQRKAWLLVHNTTPRDLSGDAQVYAAAAADLASLLFLHVQQDRSRGAHTVGAVYRLLQGGVGLVRETLRGSAIAEVREHAGTFAARERRVQEAAVTGLLQRLAAWADPLVREATARHWDLRSLGREPVALYILLPEDEAGRLQALTAWLVADLLDGLIDQSDRAGLRCPVRMYLDEFRRFGYLAGMNDRLATLRERGVSVLLGVQVLSQLEEVYGAAGARTLVGNTETKLIFRAGDLDTARMISAWLGQTSVPAVSTTRRGRRDHSTTVRPCVRPLAPPEVLARLPDRAVIAITGAARPFLLRQAQYFETPGFTATPPPFPLRRRAAPALVRQAQPPTAERPRSARTPAPRPAGGVRL
jgi:type IV secretion system protein VirD4